MNPRNEAEAARLSGWLVRHAARNAPIALADRLEEEWLADLAAQRGGLSRLRFALGCCWAMRVIARDYLASRASAAAAGRASESATLVLGQPDRLFVWRRATILALIVGFHVLAIYGFVTGLAQKMIAAIPGPMKTIIIDQPRTENPLPPRIISHLPAPALIKPVLVLSVDFPSDPIRNLTVPPRQPSPVTASLVPSRPVTRIVGGPGHGFPDTADYYPLSSRRLGEMGAATVRVCVDARGRLASAPTMAQSSGSLRLDQAALKLAAAGSGHYRSTTENGKPVSSCYPYRIRFQLKE